MALSSALILALAVTATPPPSNAGSEAASATASVRILTPALVGAELGPPAPGMEPRDSTMALPGGQSWPIRLYEFE